MKVKFCIGLILFLLMPATVLVNTSSGINPEYPPYIETHTIKVALDHSNWYVGWGSGKERFDNALNYSWTIDDQHYVFDVDEINMTLYRNLDDFSMYNVLIMAGPHDEGMFFSKDTCTVTNPNTGKEYKLDIRDLKSHLEEFIHLGGGWVGHCFGAQILLQLKNYDDPITRLEERMYNKLQFLDPDLYETRDDLHIGWPIWDEYRFFMPKELKQGLKLDNPELICQNAPLWYTGNNPSNSSCLFNGMPIDVTITDHDHPIFKDYLNDTWRVRWIGGSSFYVPADNTNVARLSSMPSTLYGNASYVVWRFPLVYPAINKIINAFKFGLDCIFPISPILPLKGHLPNVMQAAYDSYLNTTGWQQYTKSGETQYMDLQITGKPMTVAFNYPEGNNCGGRVVLCSGHPEDPIWNTTGNYIAHNENSPENNLWDCLEVWRNQTTGRLLNESDKIFNTTNWFMRREVAWAAGNIEGTQTRVPDINLPPVYGNTQIVDITPQLQEHPEFIIKCCYGHNNDETFSPMNLSLFYRYKGANSSYTWTNWTRYASIHTAPYRFTFNATQAKGNGRYEFCSILNATRLYHGTQTDYNESFPPAADASCYVGEDIVSDFSYKPGTPYVNETVYFYGEALTKNHTYITNYNWNFGDNCGYVISGGPIVKNVTHTFAHPGTFTVNFTVTNNLSQKSTALINISVLNNPPEADFSPNITIVFVHQQINFTDHSTDPDGHLVNWSWDFGDNTTSSTRNATHWYNTSDFYTVSLCVTDNDNATDTETKPKCVLAINAFVNGSLPADIPQQHKWKTIQKAIDNSSTCDLIYVHSGTYMENLTVNKSLILIGEKADSVIIEGSVTMVNPFDYELPAPDDPYRIPVISMNGTGLLMHFNNDTNVGENYTSSNIVYDYSGQQNNGKRNGATWTTSTLKGAGCFDFDGNDDSINLPSIPALTDTNVTISTWVYWNGGSGGLDPIVSQVNKTGCGYCLSVNASTREPFFQLNEAIAISSQALSPGWHNIVGTHNKTKLSIYVDGVLKGTANTTSHGVAADGFIGFDNANDYFDGRIDEVTIWNRTLSGNEISRTSSVNEISVLYNENYGVYMEGFTICDASEVGILPGNHTEVSRCVLLRNPTGIVLHDVNDVRIYQCNISSGTTGISINESHPDEYSRIQLVDCVVDDVTRAILVNESANISIIDSLVNGSLVNLTFNACNFSSMYIWCTTSVHDVAPDVPSISGPENGDRGKTYTYSACTNDSNDDQFLYLFDWDDGNNSGWLGPYWSNDRVNVSHAWSNEGGYYVKVKAKDVFNNESTWNSILFRTEMLPPIITSVQHSPDIAGFGETISIQANVTDNQTGNWSGIQTVHVNITLPDHITENYTMTYAGGDIYQYNFSDTWLAGLYNFTIWAQDNAYNNMSSSGYHFHVSADATISIATLKDSYSGDEYINITDPPMQPENYTIVDRGLDWNNYYDAVTGQNILEVFVEPVNYQNETNEWMPINSSLCSLATNHPAYSYGYRNGNDRGLFGVYFKPNAQNDWPVAFTYNRSDNPTTQVIRSKLVGVGYVDPQSNWAYQYLQNVQSSQGQTTRNSITYEDVFTGTDVTWRYDNTELKEEIILSNETKTILQNHPPSQYGLHNASSYLVFITKLDHQSLNLYNRSGVLSGNVTISHGGIEFKDALGRFKCALPLGEAYELNNESVRGTLTYRIVHLNGNTYLLSGLKVSDLNAMTFPVVIDPTLTVYTSTSDGYLSAFDSDYDTVWSAKEGTISDSEGFIAIGQTTPTAEPVNYSIYRGFLFFNTSSLPFNAIIDNAILNFYKEDDYSTTDFVITVQSGQPDYPKDPLEAGDYDKEHYGGDYESYYSGYGGGLNTTDFVDGMNEIVLTKLDWINKGSITKLCLRSSHDINGTEPTGDEYVTIYSADITQETQSYVPHLIISYRNQSKIKNTGSTDIKGYLLIQVQYYDASHQSWVVDNDTVNETSPRTINIGDHLALDTIINGMIRASDLTQGTGTYRVYAAFRDPEGNILKTNVGTELEAWWQFEYI